MNMELAQYMKQDKAMINWAEKVVARSKDKKIELSTEEVEISNEVNKFAREIADSGVANIALSQFLTKVLENEVYNAPSEILDAIFSQGEMGEFDDIGLVGSPKNTLIARESAPRTGNVDKSYVDFTRGTKQSKHLQLETEVKMSDLRRDGALTIAQITVFAMDAFENAKFKFIFNTVDNLIASGGGNYFEVAGKLTQEAMDNFAGYVEDYGNNGVIVGLTTTLRPIKSMVGYDSFMSEEMKNKLYSASILDQYNGINLGSIKVSQKMGDGSTLLPANKLYGLGGHIGFLNMKGALRVLQTVDNNREVIELKFTGFEFVYAITNPEKIAKLAIV